MYFLMFYILGPSLALTVAIAVWVEGWKLIGRLFK